MLQAGGSLEPRGAGSHAEVILSPGWRSGEDGAGEEGWAAATPLPPQPLPQPAVEGARDPRGLHRGGTLSSLLHVGTCPWRGSPAAVAQLQALGFINNAAWRWGPTQSLVTLGHSVWCLQLTDLWRSPFPSSLLFLFCCVSLGQRLSLSGVGQGQRSVEGPRIPYPFVQRPSSHRLTGTWLGKSTLEKDGLLCRDLTHSSPSILQME